jgi:hypothetical protein
VLRLDLYFVLIFPSTSELDSQEDVRVHGRYNLPMFVSVNNGSRICVCVYCSCTSSQTTLIVVGDVDRETGTGKDKKKGIRAGKSKPIPWKGCKAQVEMGQELVGV